MVTTPMTPHLISSQTLHKTIFIAIGAFLYAAGLYVFVLPQALMEGGLTGVTLLFFYLFNIPPSYSATFMHIPLFLIGWVVLGWRSMLYTIYGTVCMILSMRFMELTIERWPIWSAFETGHDVLLASLYAGVTLGTGLGIVFRAGGTTGGTDIVARLAQRWWRMPIGRAIFIIDILVIGTAAFFLPTERILYTFVMVFIASKIIDFLQKGGDTQVFLLILTNQPYLIQQKLSEKLNRTSYVVPFESYPSLGIDKKAVCCFANHLETRTIIQFGESIDADLSYTVHSLLQAKGSSP